MRKLLFIAIGIFCIAACTEKKEKVEEEKHVFTTNADSLQRIIDQKDNEIQDMLTTINEIQDGFNKISQAENRVTLAKSGEGVDVKAKLEQDIQFIAEQMKHNKELIAKLQKQVREGSIAAEQLKKTIEGLTTELENKNQQLEQLRAELAQKDVRIAELDNTVTSLNGDVAALKNESKELASQVSNQDKQLNTAWYVFGTKKELTENRILEKGKVLQGNFNKNYFTKVDIRVDREIKLYSKSAQLLTAHPATSYNLYQDATGQYILRITDPASFWSTSKYLVILVK